MSWFNSVMNAGGGKGGSYFLNQASGMTGSNDGLDWVAELGFGGGSGSTSPFSQGGFNNFMGEVFGDINALLRSSGIPIDVGGGMASAEQLLGSQLFNEVVNVNDMPGTEGYQSTSEAFLQNNPDVLEGIYRDEVAAQERDRQNRGS